MAAKHSHGQEHRHHELSHGRASSAFRWSIALNSGLTALQLVGLGLGWGADQQRQQQPQRQPLPQQPHQP